MSMYKNKNLIKYSVNLTVLLLFASLFVLGAGAGNNPEFVNITIDDNQSIVFANHNFTYGNWISLSGGDPVKLPSPFIITYHGTNFSSSTKDSTMVNVTVDVENNVSAVVTYPYTTHDMFTNVSGKNNVTMYFNGATYLAKNSTDVYLIKTSLTSLEDIFNNITWGNISELQDLLRNPYKCESNKSLDNNGDIDLPFNELGAGDYTIFILRNSTDMDNISILSATTFQVLDYDSTTVAPSEVILGNTFDADITLENPPTGVPIYYVYGAMLVHKDAYRAEIQFQFNGTRAGTNLTLNGEEIIQNCLSSVNIDMVKNIINDSIDQNNGTMATFGPTNTTNTSLTLKTSGLRTGNYILLTGVYNSEDKLVAFDQSEISINKAVVVYNGGGGGGGGGGSSGEAYENIALKNAVRLYLSVNNPVEYTFTDDANPIRNVKFTPLANKGYTSVVIEVLRNTSGLVSTPAPGLVYQNMNIWVGLAGWANEQTVSNAEIHFRVDKNWLKQNNVGYGDIVLVKHHGEKWTELPTTKTSDDSGYVYYSVKTSEFSPFAIIAKTTGGEKITPVYENDEKDDPAEIEYNESVTMTGDGEEDDSSGIPGFGAMISVGLIGAAYYMRKIRE